MSANKRYVWSYQIWCPDDRLEGEYREIFNLGILKLAKVSNRGIIYDWHDCAVVTFSMLKACTSRKVDQLFEDIFHDMVHYCRIATNGVTFEQQLREAYTKMQADIKSDIEIAELAKYKGIRWGKHRSLIFQTFHELDLSNI